MWTDAVANEILERIANGEPVASICRDARMPGYSTIDDWRANSSEFAGRFARAREHGHDYLAAECLAIANTPKVGVETVTRGTGKGAKVEKRSGDMLGHRKLQIETRLKLLEKWDPKRYGNKTDLAVTGSISLESLLMEAAKLRDEAKTTPSED